MNNEEYKSVESELKRKTAFTLAEVLITLGIIGVVAAITMPTIIKNYQKQMFANKVKYTYTLLANVYERSKIDNGEFSTWDIGEKRDRSVSGYMTERNNERKAIVEKYFAPYLKIVERIKNDNGYHLVIANGITLTFTTDGIVDENNIQTPTEVYIVASNNNNTDTYHAATRDYSHHDVFLRMDKNKVEFMHWGGTSVNAIKINSKYGCNNNIQKNLRFNCGAWIMKNGWRIPDDYPW